MRINYYSFPDSVPAAVRAANGASVERYDCPLHPDRYNDSGSDSPSRGCPSFDGHRGCIDCSHLVPVEAAVVVDCITVTECKRLLREFGGSACTQHHDRNGGLFETTPIALGKNNSRHKYNRHL